MFHPVRASLRAAPLRTSAPARSFARSAPRADVGSSAKNAAEGAAKQFSNAAEKARAAAGPIAERISGATGLNFGALSEKLVYNLRVAGSLFKQVYVAEGLAPPKSVGAVREAYATLYARAANPEYWSKVAGNGEWKKIAVYAVEALGIFSIGEIIGRRKLVGYPVKKHAVSHAPAH